MQVGIARRGGITLFMVFPHKAERTLGVNDVTLIEDVKGVFGVNAAPLTEDVEKMFGIKRGTPVVQSTPTAP